MTTIEQIEQFNRPNKRAVAINCDHIGDDNDYSCFLSSVIVNLYKAGHKQQALDLMNTDSMLTEKQDMTGLEAFVSKRLG